MAPPIVKSKIKNVIINYDDGKEQVISATCYNEILLVNKKTWNSRVQLAADKINRAVMELML